MIEKIAYKIYLFYFFIHIFLVVAVNGLHRKLDSLV